MQRSKGSRAFLVEYHAFVQGGRRITRADASVGDSETRDQARPEHDKMIDSIT